MEGMIQQISSPEAMHQYGKELAGWYPVIFLSGDLGVGKTTFAKGFAEWLGIDPAKVQSPTYTYLNIYDNKLLHVDMYRLEQFDEMIEKGILDQLSNFSYILIERPKWEKELGLSGAVKLEIKKLNENERTVELITL